MRLAAIDVGTNSIHTVIVDVAEDLDITIQDRSKDTVHLLRGRDPRGNLKARAMTDALRALRTARRLCDRHKVERVLAVATSAIREAPNGLEFLRHAKDKTGIDVHVITGSEEARLIYLAVRESVHLGGDTFMAIDIGGGSVELIVGNRESLYGARSLKLGALRVAEEFPLSDPPTDDELAAVRGHFDSELAEFDKISKTHSWQRTIGTSGTILQLGRLASGNPELSASRSHHQETVSAAALHEWCERLSRSTMQERTEMKGLDGSRVHNIVPGALLLDAILSRYGVNELTVCEYALREGVVYDFVARNQRGLREDLAQTDIRRRSVVSLGRRFGWEEAHARHIARLALMIFDQLAPEFEWESEERDLLEFAALLHDIGTLISVPHHHRHSQYLVEHGELLGFGPREVAILANVVRYHRGSMPSKKHKGYRLLSGSDQRIVDRLSGILRVTEALDRTRFALIQSVQCDIGTEVHMTAMASGDAEVELSLASERSDLLAHALGRPVRIQLGDIDLVRDGLVPSATRSHATIG